MTNATVPIKKLDQRIVLAMRKSLSGCYLILTALSSNILLDFFLAVFVFMHCQHIKVPKDKYFDFNDICERSVIVHVALLKVC